MQPALAAVVPACLRNTPCNPSVVAETTTPLRGTCSLFSRRSPSLLTPPPPHSVPVCVRLGPPCPRSIMVVASRSMWRRLAWLRRERACFAKSGRSSSPSCYRYGAPPPRPTAVLFRLRDGRKAWWVCWYVDIPDGFGALCQAFRCCPTPQVKR